MSTPDDLHVSIVTVVKNDLENLKYTFNSLSSQENRNFEWVVVDGSTNNEICDYLTSVVIDFPHTYARRTPNGIYDAMNAAIELLNTNWIWFINAGDFFTSSNSIGIMVKEISETSSELIATEVLNLTRSGYLISTSKPSIIKIDTYEIANFNHQGVAMRSELFISAGRFDTKLRFAADGKLLDRAIALGTAECINAALVAFRLGGASSVNYGETVKETLTYRPPIENTFRRHSNSIRNHIRRIFLDLENSFFLGHWIKRYFKSREKSAMCGLNFSHNDLCDSTCPIVKHF